MTYAPWRVSRLSSHVVGLDFKLDAEHKTAGVFLSSDHHTDNALSDLKTLGADLKAARDANIACIFAGDTACAMQGKWDKRADQNQLRPELRGNNYLDRLVDFHANFYEPYAPAIAAISYGNHEGSIIKRHETDLVQRIASRLVGNRGYPLVMPYQHFIRVQLNLGKIQQSRTICIHHGYGGGGEVTRGMIDNNRTRSQYLADVFFSGHIHRRNYDENELVTVSKTGERVVRSQYFLRGGAYTTDLESEWQVSRGMAARPKRGWWVYFTMNPYRDNKVQRVEVDIECRRGL